MKGEFTIPARPWGEADIKFLMANQDLLDNETRVELGLGEVAGAPEDVPTAEGTPSEEVVEETTEEVVEDAPEADAEVEEGAGEDAGDSAQPTTEEGEADVNKEEDTKA